LTQSVKVTDTHTSSSNYSRCNPNSIHSH